ncbi:MAG: hypothetical protein HY906_08055 [Deltaproteobacteria bacterium]|nr:hypothetical protein [Deltaproteobacteria bacterium]
MNYVNPETGLEIKLGSLSASQERFYRQALEKLRQNAPWLAFDAFAFGAMSPLFVGRKSHLEVLRIPLYQALKDMSLQLGVQQGMIRRTATKEKPRRERREEAGGRKTSKWRHGENERHLAAAR